MNWIKVTTGVCLILSLLLVSLSAAGQYGIPTAVPVASSLQNLNWASFRGVVYRWQNLTLSPDQPPGPNPSTWFPLMRSLRFNYARIDNMDWKYLQQNTALYDSLLQNVANAADANGFHVVYIFGGDSHRFPVDLFQPTGPYCLGTTSCRDQFANDFMADNMSLLPGGLYHGMTIWEYIFENFLTPLIQQLDSHPSTAGYEIWNEPANGTPQQLHNYYEYELQRMRTLTSKALVFQTNAGGSGDIVTDAPTLNLAPYVFEIHNYQGVLNYNPYPQVAADCATAGCAGIVLGEWHFDPNTVITPYTSLTQEITDELNTVKQNGMANSWFSAACDSNTPELLDNSCQLTAEALLLSQLTNQILGPVAGSTSATSTTVTTTTQTTSIGSSSTTSATSSTQSTSTVTSTASTSTPTTTSTSVGTSQTSTTALTTSTATTTTVTSTSSSSLKFISIQLSSGPYYVGDPINLSGTTFANSNGSVAPSQTIYIWVNGQNQGLIMSSSSGSWTFSFTPGSTGTYYVSASQNPNGSGVTSAQLLLKVAAGSTSTTTSTSTSSSSTITSTTLTTTATSTSSTTTTATTESTSTTSTTLTTTTAASRSSSTTSTSTTATTTSNSQSTTQVTTTGSITTSSTEPIITTTSPTNVVTSTTSSIHSTTFSSNTASIGSSSITNATTTSNSTSSSAGQWATAIPGILASWMVIPFVTSPSPSSAGIAIFACEVGLVSAAPFAIRNAIRRRKENSGTKSRGWRW